jgi:myosin heavy subunit
MNANGVMEEIRNLLRAGRSSTETIALGYKPSTVYKAQRQLGKSTAASGPPVTTQVLVTNMASEDSIRLREEIQVLREQVSSLAKITAERDSFREELDSALLHIEELAPQAKQARMWQKRLVEVEPAVAESAALRREIKDLNRHLSYSRAVMDQHSQQWQAEFQQEQEDLRVAEDLVARRDSEIDQLKTKNHGLTQQLEAIPGLVSDKFAELVQPLLVELEQLRPLKVWTGHPCSKCGKPISGATSRELATDLLREAGFRHVNCVRKWPWG